MSRAGTSSTAISIIQLGRIVGTIVIMLALSVGGKVASSAQQGGGLLKDQSGAGAPQSHSSPYGIHPERRDFWAFRPVRRPTAPTVKLKGWGHNPIDAFILAALEKNG